MTFSPQEYAEMAIKANEENKILEIIDDKLVLTEPDNKQIDELMNKEKK